jgi:predicted RNA methylase
MLAAMGRRSGQRFDAEHGVTTEALLFLGELDPHAIGEAMADATHYEPVPVAEFTALLDAVDAPLEGFTFVDLGCGMGRALMLATRYPFKQIVGVEVSPALAAIARENVTRWMHSHDNLRCRDVRIVRRDATLWALPAGDLVVFLYNPFGEKSMRRLLDRWSKRTKDHRLIVIYHTPVHAQVLRDREDFHTVTVKPFGMVFGMGSK